MLPIYIEPIKAFVDNYIWALINPDNKTIWVVDPGDANPVIEFIKKNNLRLCGILITHHHYDHCDGVKLLLEQYSIPVYGPEHVDIFATHVVHEEEEIFLAECGLRFKVLSIPGHTLEHVAYYCEKQQFIFCGDTLFSAGCGRIFEGTPQQMYDSLMKIAALPDETKVYCTHEYTFANLQFAKQVEPQNSDIITYIDQVQACRDANQPSLPSTIGIEKKINPFLRSKIKEVINMAENRARRKLKTPLDVFVEIRTWKNNF